VEEMNDLEQAKHYEKFRSGFEIRMESSKIMRDYYILKAFESGLRQKEIANALGLSESRVKKIIGEIRTK
jgi:DNA-binding NarL/FixJ family response regulator